MLLTVLTCIFGIHRNYADQYKIIESNPDLHLTCYFHCNLLLSFAVDSIYIKFSHMNKITMCLLLNYSSLSQFNCYLTQFLPLFKIHLINISHNLYHYSKYI